ncbi:MAG TPA: PRC-barrel domain containing protein [Candidatus Methylomirabilis sp.]|nr:PRC-barrel domain containing protein [Candidatus Methylomirabilis sp.]
MLRRVRDLQHYTIHAIDGDIGRVHEFYFDDQRWTVCHMVVTTGAWLARHRVLIPTLSLARVDAARGELSVALTKLQVATSPGIDTEKPVSRQHEGELYWHYGFTGVPLPIGMQPGGDPHLRRTREVVGYVVHRVHERIGDVDDFLVDDASWNIRYMVVKVQERWTDKRVLVQPRSVVGITWEERAVHVDLSRAALRNAPEYDPRRPIDRDYEMRLQDYYDRSKHSEDRPAQRSGLLSGMENKRLEGWGHRGNPEP